MQFSKSVGKIGFEPFGRGLRPWAYPPCVWKKYFLNSLPLNQMTHHHCCGGPRGKQKKI